MNAIRKIVSDKKEVIIVDYSNCNVEEMIKLAIKVGELIKKENKPVLLLSIVNNKSYATPDFVKRAQQVTKEIDSLLGKQAVAGLNKIKKIILKGHNLLFNKNIQAFDTEKEAIQFLLDDHTSDHVVQEN